MLSEEFGFAARCIKGCCTMRCVDIIVLLYFKYRDVIFIVCF